MLAKLLNLTHTTVSGSALRQKADQPHLQSIICSVPIVPTSGEPPLPPQSSPRNHRAWVTADTQYRYTGVGCSRSKPRLEFLAERNHWATPEAIFGWSPRYERIHRSTGGAASRHQKRAPSCRCGCFRRAWRRAARHYRVKPRRSCSGAWPGSAAPRAWSPCLRIGAPL